MLYVRADRFEDTCEAAISAGEPPLVHQRIDAGKTGDHEEMPGHAIFGGAIAAICSPAWSSARSNS